MGARQQQEPGVNEKEQETDAGNCRDYGSLSLMVMTEYGTAPLGGPVASRSEENLK